MTRDELLALPVVVDVETAGQALGIGRTKAFQLAKAGEFPVPVLRLGAKYRVPTGALLTLLGVTPDMSEAAPASAATATTTDDTGGRRHAQNATPIRLAHPA